MKPIFFSKHALENMTDRGANRDEVEQAIRLGEQVPAKQGRNAFRRNFLFENNWKGKFYQAKQVMPIVVEKPDRWIVVTVYVFFIGGSS